MARLAGWFATSREELYREGTAAAAAARRGSSSGRGPTAWRQLRDAHIMKHCRIESKMKMMSTQRLVMKRPSAHRSAGMSMKPTSTGVMMAVKMSAKDVSQDHLV
jgi:hypothetical protein